MKCLAEKTVITGLVVIVIVHTPVVLERMVSLSSPLAGPQSEPASSIACTACLTRAAVG